MQLVNTTVEDVAIKESLSYDSVLGILERCVEAQVDWSGYMLWIQSGWMKIALRKGHRNFVVIVTARLASGRIANFGCFGRRQKESVVEFLRSIPERLKKTIESACCDMYEGFYPKRSEKNCQKCAW